MNRIKSFDQWNNWSRTNENEKDCDCGDDRESIDREEFQITEAPEAEESNPSLEVKIEEPTMEPVITVEEPVESTEETPAEEPAEDEIEAAETEEEVEDEDNKEEE